jgi:hypothetical protein
MARARTRTGYRRCPRGLEVQTLLFPKDRFTPSSARAWARSHDFASAKVDVTADLIRIRNRPPSVFVRGSFRTIPMSRDGIQAVVACPLPGKEADTRKRRQASGFRRQDATRAIARTGMKARDQESELRAYRRLSPLAKDYLDAFRSTSSRSELYGLWRAMSPEDRRKVSKILAGERPAYEQRHAEWGD